jgi:hypothetical protein
MDNSDGTGNFAFWAVTIEDLLKKLDGHREGLTHE